MDRSRIFTPPVDTVPNSEPMLVKVPLDHLEWGNRTSQQKGWDNTSGAKNIRNLPNGK